MGGCPGGQGELLRAPGGGLLSGPVPEEAEGAGLGAGGGAGVELEEEEEVCCCCPAELGGPEGGWGPWGVPL